MGEEGTEIGHCGGQDQLLQTSGEERGLNLQQQQFVAVATLGFINIIPLLLDLVYHNRILFDLTDVNNNNNNNAQFQVLLLYIWLKLQKIRRKQILSFIQRLNE